MNAYKLNLARELALKKLFNINGSIKLYEQTMARVIKVIHNQTISNFYFVDIVILKLI